MLLLLIMIAAPLALTAIILNPVTQPGVLRTRRLGFQLARSGVLFGSTLLNFVALRYLQLAETVSITFFTPLRENVACTVLPADVSTLME